MTMDFNDIRSILRNSKVSISEKLNTIKKLSISSNNLWNHAQFVIDWTCSSLEYVSKTDRLLQENHNDINALITLLNEELCKCAHNQGKLFLKANFFEVFIKFFKQANLINQTTILDCWFYLIQRETWRYVLMVKFNVMVEVLSNVCSHFWHCCSNNTTENNEKHLFIIFTLIPLYLKQVQSSYNVKKVFIQFCNKLLLHLLCVKVSCDKLKSKESDDVATLVEKLFSSIFSISEHMGSLKGVLKQEQDLSESAVKKRKVDLYFTTFFEVIIVNDPQGFLHVLQAIPSVYEILVRCARINKSLTHYEEFQLLLHISSILKLKEHLKDDDKTAAIRCFNSLLKVILKYDIYQSVEDAECENKGFDWMKDLVNSLLHIYAESDVNNKENILEILISMLDTNHLVLECYLEQLWEVCLYAKTDCTTSKEILLCNLLTCYDRLHQLDKLLNGVSMTNSSDMISYPPSFIEKYSTVISGLQNSQINALLETFLQKIVSLCSDVTDGSIFSLKQSSYLQCYAVLINAAVVPESGYIKQEIKVTLQLMRKLKVQIKAIMDDKQFKDYQNDLYCIHLLVQHGINSLYLLLREFSLVDESDHNLFECNLQKKKKSSNPIVKYLEICLYFDELRSGVNITNTLDILRKVLCDAQLSETQWNKQILCVNTCSYGNALIYLYEQNIFTLMAYNDAELIKLYAKKVWESNTYGHGMANDIVCYNDASFQIGLLLSINDDVFSILKNKKLQSAVEKLLNEEVDEIELIKMNVEGKCKTMIAEKEESIIKVLNILSGLPIEYLTERNLLALLSLVLEVQHSFIKNKNNEIDRLCIDVMVTILDTAVVTSHKALELPLQLLFLRNLKYHVCKQETSDVRIFGSCMKAWIEIAPKDDKNNKLSNVCPQIVKYFDNGTHLKATLNVCHKLLDVVSQILVRPALKSRSLSLAYMLVSDLITPLLTILRDATSEKSMLDVKLFNIYTCLCFIFQHAYTKSCDSNRLALFHDALLDVSKLLLPRLQSFLNDESEENERTEQCLEALNVMYGSADEFTLRLRALLQRSDCGIVSSLLKKMESNSMQLHRYAKLVTSITIRNDDDSLLVIYECLATSMITSLQKPFNRAVLIVWKTLLSSKLTKEQRIVLWKVLPQIMLCCVQLLSKCDSSSDTISVLQTMTSIVTMCKHSLMSQYVTCLYHTFVFLPEHINKFNYESFSSLFEEMYHLTSQLLFNHQSAIYTSLHAYLNCVNCLLNSLVSYTRNTKKHHSESDKKEFQNCCERMARLYREIGSHKSVITKYSPYIIADYVRACQHAKLDTVNKSLLDGGIYCIMDTCSEFEFSLLTTVLEKADKEHFRVIRNEFEKHHKFLGKA